MAHALNFFWFVISSFLLLLLLENDFKNRKNELDSLIEKNLNQKNISLEKKNLILFEMGLREKFAQYIEHKNSCNCLFNIHCNQPVFNSNM